jgi:hypothetical protein
MASAAQASRHAGGGPYRTPRNIQMTSKWMENRMPRQTKPTDTEKITINIG